MGSYGPSPPPAAATPGAAAIYRVTLLQHPLSSKDNASTSSDILAAVSQATAAAVLIPGSTSTPMTRRCNFSSQDVPCLGLLDEVAPVVPSAGRTRARTSCYLRRRDGKECRLCTHNGTKALIFAQGIILYCTPETICQKFIIRT